MTNVSAEDQPKKNQRQTRRDSRPEGSQPEPITPPLIVDGPELVRDSRC
jgi:hypothetical protein